MDGDPVHFGAGLGKMREQRLLKGGRFMRFVGTLVAHRWQSWLLVTALLSVIVTGVLV